jgi:hypothetical protein
MPALETVRGHLKTASMLWMQALGLPVLSGVVVSDWSRKSATAVRKFSSRRHLTKLLLRIDKQGERWTRRRGGYLLPIAQVGETVRKLRKEGFISVLLEPASPYSDRYSLAGVTVPEQQKLVVEIVGAGFDASDILRSDVPTHERWEFNLESVTRGRGSTTFQSRQLGLISAAQYQTSVQHRLAKIGARIKNPAFPDEVLAKADKEELAASATIFLKRSRQTMLLRGAENYVPIPQSYLFAFAKHISQLLSGLAGYGIHLGSSSFAASVLPQRGLVFWDFFPARKQEAASLYPTA